ncbi:MAG: carboxypeptidase-like regulatory domain-containing protein [Pedobacter sp.]|nr:MAG: carboxypeptidase-like regulatory domain-containing protein [Pedobacter sp.]
MKQPYLLVIFLQLIFLTANAQFRIDGKIKDASGQPVSFGSVYVKGTTQGTSANAEGVFNISLSKGDHTLVFKAIGFKALEKPVSLDKNTEINITLIEESYTLKDVVIRANAEDPAYEMIRKTIRKRKMHLNEVNEFSCEVYIKGLQRMLSAPKKFLGQDIQKGAKEMGLDSNRQGIIYLSESESKYSFKRPNLVHEEMISSKVSGSNRAFSFNRASDMRVNFYENLLTLDGLSLRPIVSPIADNALFYYNYKFLGETTVSGNTVNKIEVIPKRRTDPVYRGIIYIIEDQWRLYDVDLVLTKDANLNFVDTLQIRQQFISVDKDVWMPSTIQFEFKGGLFGFNFGGYFIGIFKNYDINNRKPAKTFNEVMRITREVNKKDSAYWESSRPIPLTEEEVSDYKKKEVLAQKRESKTYLDSLDRENNKFKPFKFLLGSGYSHRNRFEKEYYRFSSIKDALFYNTVEGWGLDYTMSYSKQIDSITNKFINASAKLRYGFASEKFYPLVGFSFPAGKFNLSISGGGDVLDLNNQAFQSQLSNSISTLYFERNRLKLYEKTFAAASISGRIYGGITGSIFAEYANRDVLQNNSSYKWRNVKDREFTSNNPFTPLVETPLFPENQSFKMGFRMSYNFSNKYVTYPSGKFYVGSKYPRLSVGYTKGFSGIFGSDVDYDLVSADLSKNNIPLGFYGKFSFMVGAGKFLNNKKVFYTDYKHFTGNEGTVFSPRNNGFLFLDFYTYSTSRSYAEVHVDHNFSGFILNKIPLIRKAKLEEIVGANYLTTPNAGNYAEVYFGFQHMIGIQVYYGYSFQNGRKVEDGIKIGFRL